MLWLQGCDTQNLNTTVDQPLQWAHSEATALRVRRVRSRLLSSCFLRPLPFQPRNPKPRSPKSASSQSRLCLPVLLLAIGIRKVVLSFPNQCTGQRKTKASLPIINGPHLREHPWGHLKEYRRSPDLSYSVEKAAILPVLMLFRAARSAIQMSTYQTHHPFFAAQVSYIHLCDNIQFWLITRGLTLTAYEIEYFQWASTSTFVGWDHFSYHGKGTYYLIPKDFLRNYTEC